MLSVVNNKINLSLENKLIILEIAKEAVQCNWYLINRVKKFHKIKKRRKHVKIVPNFSNKCKNYYNNWKIKINAMKKKLANYWNL